MGSDSDSDGSHISSTPPRNPPPPPPPPQDTRFATLLSSVKSRTTTKSKTSFNTSRTNLRPKISKKKKSTPVPKIEEQPLDNAPSIPSSTIPAPVTGISAIPHIHQNAPEVLLIPAGHCQSKLFFARSHRKILNFEPDCIPAEVKSKVPAEGVGVVKDESVVVKNVRKNLNLIGGSNASEPAPKKFKCVSSEGNFVKLNINGYGRKKFAFKNKGKNFRSSSRRRNFFKKSSKENGVKDAGEESGVVDEEGLVVDVKGGKERSGFVSELIEEAVRKVRDEASDENLVELLKLTNGYSSFRDGQLEAIKMVLSGQSTMLVLPTGAGKSLCYQLPALVLPGITIVVSPLVALMIDQLKQLPRAIRGGLLSSSQTAEEASETLRSLQEGVIKVLFVSPERFLNAEFISLFSGPSVVSLVVVDEAHCVSEWSHNFRPSYMRLRASLLRGKLNAGCILAMTATATTRTLRDVMHALEIPPTNLIHSAKLRDNLHLSVSTSRNRQKDLRALLQAPPFLDIKSIIIYCKFQSETDMISKYLCDNNISAKSYHSGLPAKDRFRVQDLFCSNKIRVVVATVAFGMGLDKKDVGAVIHYSLPESLEEYVQEIGRSGRDGRVSYCHLLFDDATYFKLRSLMYSDGVDEYNVSKLLSEVFKSNQVPNEEICSLLKESASRKFDMKEEVILTILTQLELGEGQYIHLLPQMNVTCTLNFHQTTPALLAAKDVVVASILKKSEMKDGQYVFHMPSVSNSIRLQALDLSNHLLSLKLRGEISYELKDQAFCYKIVAVPKDICSLASRLTKWLGEIETSKVWKIDAMFNATSFAAKMCDKSLGCHKNEHTPCLQKKILDYFDGDGNADVSIQMDGNSSFLRADVKVFLQSNSHAKFTPRAIARILHGLSSPAFPSSTWSRTHFWGRHTNLDFKLVMEAARAELLNFVGKNVT